MSIAFRRIQPGGLPEAVRLINAYYARKKTEDYFHWQYFQAPFGAALYGAFAGADLIGMFGLQVKQLSNELRCGQAMDMLVRENFRGRGVFTALARCALQEFGGLDLFCVFPNLSGRQAVERGLGWKTLLKIPTYVLTLEDVPRHGSGPPQRPAGASLVPSGIGAVAFRYTDAYARWRFEDHPLHAYATLSSGEMVAVLKVFHDPRTHQAIGDCVHLSDGGDPRQISKLLDRAIAFLHAQGVSMVTTWACNRPRLELELKRRGFSEQPQERYFCLHVNRPDSRHLENPAVWRLDQADTEVF